MTPLRLAGIKACVFDAYGTLFDVNSAARGLQDELGPRWQPLAELWRTKQLQYTWLRGLGGHHADFWTVTSDALSFALETLKIDDAELHRRLMKLYLALNVYPDVVDTLERLKAGGMRLAILSNGTPAMLASAATNSNIAGLLEAVLSVEDVGVFTPKSKSADELTAGMVGWVIAGIKRVGDCKIGGVYMVVIIGALFAFFWSVAYMTGTLDVLFGPLRSVVPGLPPAGPQDLGV